MTTDTFTTTTPQTMIRGAQVFATSEDASELRLTSSQGDIHPDAAHELLLRMRDRAEPCVALESAGVAAKQATLAIPVMADGVLRSIVILYVKCVEDSVGAFEVWSRDQREELAPNGGIFSGVERFARISRQVCFPRGSGLPGQCWEDREAKLISGLGGSANFMRAAGARGGGLDVGLALPVMESEHNLKAVVMLLSSRRSPIARVIEVWDVDAAHETVQLRANAGTDCQATLGTAIGTKSDLVSGLAGSIVATGYPRVTNELAHLDKHRSAQFSEDGLTTAIAIPVYVGAKLKSVVMMLN